jgi:hypothetical protein
VLQHIDREMGQIAHFGEFARAFRLKAPTRFGEFAHPVRVA